MRLSIRHTTRYRFSEPVAHGLQRLRLTPKETQGQRIVDWTIEFEGARAELVYDDQNHNHVTLLSVEEGAQEVVIACSGTVKTEDKAGVIGQQPPAEGVDGTDREVVEGAQERPRPGRTLRGGRQQPCVQPVGDLAPRGDARQLPRGPAGHLRRRRLGEGDGHHAAQDLGGNAVRCDLFGPAEGPGRGPFGEAPLRPLPAGAQGPGQEPADEGRGLPRARPGLEDQGTIEPGLGRPAGVTVLLAQDLLAESFQEGHGSPSSFPGFSQRRQTFSSAVSAGVAGTVS